MEINLKSIWVLLFLLILALQFGPFFWPNFIGIDIFMKLEIFSRLIVIMLLYGFVIFYPMYEYGLNEKSKFWGISSILVLSYVLYLGIVLLFERNIL